MKAAYRYSLSLSALFACVQPALAEEPTVESLIHPQSQVEIGVAGVMDEARKFGVFNGMSGTGAYPIFDLSILQRDDQTGTWLRFNAENFGLAGGGFRFEHEKQGDWNYFLESERSTYTNPRVINTSITGLGSTQNFLGGAINREVDLEMHRDKIKLGGGKKLGEGFATSFSAREERKTGMRQWGAQGASSTFNFAVEPIEFTTQEFDGKISYTGKQLQMQAGYLGSLFTNQAEYLKSVSTQEPILSLPSNNMQHNIYLNGGYGFTPTTRGTFNFSYGYLTQNEDFFTPPTQAGNSRTDLGGKVHNTLANLALTSRPMKDLSTRVKLRHEERNDNTTLARYVSGSTTRNGYNVPFSRTTSTGDAEAAYQLPMQFKLIGGIGYEHWERSSPPVRHTAFRKETDEASVRVSLRRPLLESLSGSVGYVHSERTGSGLQSDGTDQVDPILWADRSRDKGRVTLDWSPSSVFSLQFIGEASKDNYTSDRFYGPQDGVAHFASLDANYKFADDWDVSGWVAWNDTMIEQRTRTTSTGIPWEARLKHIGKAIGATLTGKVTDQIKLTTDLQRTEDTSVHGIMSFGGSTGIGPSLPDIEYRQWLFTATGDYAIQENNGLKLKYGFSHTTARDWTWQGFTYADGTQVKIPDNEQAHFIGLSYYHRW